MRIRKFDTNGDYTLTGTGNDYYVDSAQAVAQAIQAGLALLQGEWFLDTSQGMPWRTEVLGKYTAPGYDSVIKSQILSTAGVQSISSYSSSFDPIARALTVNATVESIYGPATVATTL
jgi:hypothetical protein